MRLTLQLLGYELDLTLGPAAVEPEPEFKPYQDAGTTSGTMVGFTASIMPEWEAAPSYHSFEPEPDGEDAHHPRFSR